MATMKQCLVIGPITGGVRSLKAESFAAEGVRFFGTRLKYVSVAKPALDAESAFCSRSANHAGLRVRCMVAETKRITEKKTVLHDLYEQERQSPWYDNLSRPVTDLIPFIENGVRGVTSNPTIFAKAISGSNAYDDQFRQLMKEGNGVESAYWGLVVKDIQDALDLFLPVFEESKGDDGYVSVEVSPSLAHDTQGTVEAAKWLHKSVNRPNVYIKIPATADCVPSIKEVIGHGISVNVTLIFSLPRYEAVIEAYLAGLEDAASAGLDLSKISSVASFFVSRVDTLVDKKLEAIGTE
jgi:transaldolase